MAQGAYIGVSGKARRIAGGFIGVSGKARRIAKAYIGVGGKARPCWDSGARIAYYGSVTSLSEQSGDLAGAKVGDYGLFSGKSNAIDGFTNAYKSSLVRSIPSVPTELDTLFYNAPQAQVLGATISNKAVFVGTFAEEGSVIYSYGSTLSVNVLDSLSTARHDCAITTINNNVLIGGGTDDSFYSHNDTTPCDSVEVYTSTLTKGTSLTLSVGRAGLTATNNSKFAIFAGGYNSTVVDAFNASLVRTTPTALKTASEKWEGGTTVNYALFVLGSGGTQEAFNDSLTKTTLSNSHYGYDCGKTTLNNHAIFAGGQHNGNLNTVHFYNNSLIHSTARPLNASYYDSGGVTIGNYALIAGGYTGSGYLSTVIVYTFIS